MHKNNLVIVIINNNNNSITRVGLLFLAVLHT